MSRLEPDARAFWARIETWASEAALPPDLLRSPANPPELDALDEALDTGCPDVLRALLSVHDGAGHGWYCFADGYFLATDEILALKLERTRLASMLFDPEAGSPECLGTVRPLWWSDLWIPFLMRNKEPVCIDLGPATGGSRGQIIEIDWEGRCNKVVAASMKDFLDQVLAALA
jgi:cell wall assembly regulator SMI1